SSPLGFHANVAIVLEHLLRNMTRDVHDGLVARATLRQFRDERMPVVMPAPLHAGLGTDIRPHCLERGDVAGWVSGLRGSEREDIPFRLDGPKLVCVPRDIVGEYRKQL